MTKSEWARSMAHEFKAARARKHEEDANLQQDQTTRREIASELWTKVKRAFKAKAQMFNAAAGEQILTWEEGDANTFGLQRKDIEGCVKGSYQETANEFNIEVLGRPVPLHVALEHRTREYCLFGASGKPFEPDELAETLIEEFLRAERPTALQQPTPQPPGVQENSR